MPQFANPSDYFMKRLTINYPKSDKDLRKIEYFKESYESF
jgi:hypothetical protein